VIYVFSRFPGRDDGCGCFGFSALLLGFSAVVFGLVSALVVGLALVFGFFLLWCLVWFCFGGWFLPAVVVGFFPLWCLVSSPFGVWFLPALWLIFSRFGVWFGFSAVVFGLVSACLLLCSCFGVWFGFSAVVFGLVSALVFGFAR